MRHVTVVMRYRWVRIQRVAWFIMKMFVWVFIFTPSPIFGVIWKNMSAYFGNFSSGPIIPWKNSESIRIETCVPPSNAWIKSWKICHFVSWVIWNRNMIGSIIRRFYSLLSRYSYIFWTWMKSEASNVNYVLCNLLNILDRLTSQDDIFSATPEKSFQQSCSQIYQQLHLKKIILIIRQSFLHMRQGWGLLE